MADGRLGHPAASPTDQRCPRGYCDGSTSAGCSSQLHRRNARLCYLKSPMNAFPSIPCTHQSPQQTSCCSVSSSVVYIYHRLPSPVLHPRPALSRPTPTRFLTTPSSNVMRTAHINCYLPVHRLQFRSRQMGDGGIKFWMSGSRGE